MSERMRRKWDRFVSWGSLVTTRLMLSYLLYLFTGVLMGFGFWYAHQPGYTGTTWVFFMAAGWALIGAAILGISAIITRGDNRY